MEKLKMHTPDLTQDNIARIRELFPNCVTEAQAEYGKLKLAVDFDLLRQELSESIVQGPQERYHLDWPGKKISANYADQRRLEDKKNENLDLFSPNDPDTHLRKSAQSADKSSFEIFFVDENALIACFDVGITEALVKHLAQFEPLRVVFRDTGFVSDAVKINVEQIFKQMSPYTEVRSIWPAKHAKRIICTFPLTMRDCWLI